MKISLRNIPKFQNGTTNRGIGTVSWTNPNSTWFTRSGNNILEGTYNYLKLLYDKWNTTKNFLDYDNLKKAVDQLNLHLRTGYAPNHLRYLNGNNQLFTDTTVGDWLNIIKNNYSFVNDAIGKNYSQYKIHSNNPLSGDNPTSSFKVDNYWAGITQDRTPWGYYGNENDPEYLKWKEKFSEIGIEYKTGPEAWKTGNVLYGFLKNDVVEPAKLNTPSPTVVGKEKIDNINTSHKVTHLENFGFDWSKLKTAAQNIFGNPNLYAFGRLAGNLINNERVYEEALKAIQPNLINSYNTHRQIVGDEATKQAYYRRAAEGETKASRPFTSDADKQMAYQMEAKRVGDQLRAQGDLADNQMIQKTSDESNQHQWANQQRDNQVAIANLASKNDANARKHNLSALKWSALLSSIDNFLLGIEYRKRQKQQQLQNLQDLVFLTQLENDLLYDNRILEAQREYLKVLKDNDNDLYNVDVITARRKVLAIKNQILLELLKKYLDYIRNNHNTYYMKLGSKVTYKRKDDLLYKSAKDVVEHFRKITKLAYDSIKNRPKQVKLVSHPKGSTRKYLLGGVAPFTVYKPVALGGETTTTSGSSTTSTTSTKSKDYGLDLLKDLFKNLNTEGLPSDVNAIYSNLQNLFLQQAIFGNDLTTEDIQSLYLKSMMLINNVKFAKALYDTAAEIVSTKEAGSEIAIDLYGRVAVQDSKTGKISFKNYSEKEKNDILLTNNDILKFRAYDINHIFDTLLILAATNATSMSEIGKFLKAQLPVIESSETTIEGYTKKDSNLIKQGLKVLAEAPEGSYKYSETTKDNLLLITMALSYLYNILPKNMLTLLDINSGGNPEKIILSLVGAKTSNTYKYELQAVTGKASTSDGTKSGSGTNTPSAVQFLLGNGYLEKVEFNIGNSLSVTALGRFGILLDVNKHNLGQGSTLLDVSTSQFGPILDLDKATFGGSRLISPAYSHIILNNSDCVGVDLPVKKDISGNYVPDFQLLTTIEKAEEYINKNNITDFQEVNKVYTDLGLPKKFDSNGNLILQNYKRFAAILVILDLKALKGGVPINMNEVLEADESERELFIEIMRNAGNKDYDLSDGILWSPWGKDKLYKGTIFAPVREDIVGGYISGGLPLNYDLPNDANKVAIMQHAPKIQEYKNAPPLSSLK